MADELVQQAQELFEGQIVSRYFALRPALVVDLVSRISKAKSKPSSYPPSSWLFPVYASTFSTPIFFFGDGR